MPETPEPEKIQTPSLSLLLYLIAGGQFMILIWTWPIYLATPFAFIAALVLPIVLIALGRILAYTNEIAIRMRRVSK